MDLQIKENKLSHLPSITGLDKIWYNSNFLSFLLEIQSNSIFSQSSMVIRQCQTWVLFGRQFWPSTFQAWNRLETGPWMKIYSYYICTCIIYISVYIYIYVYWSLPKPCKKWWQIISTVKQCLSSSLTWTVGSTPAAPYGWKKTGSGSPGQLTLKAEMVDGNRETSRVVFWESTPANNKLAGGFKYFLFSTRKLGKMNPFFWLL